MNQVGLGAASDVQVDRGRDDLGGTQGCGYITGARQNGRNETRIMPGRVP